MGKAVVHKIEISHRTIVFTVLFLVFLWFLYQIRHILTILFIGTILMTALNPLVKRLERLKIPRILAVIAIYLVIFGLFGLILAGVIPPLISQISTLIPRIPSYYESLEFWGIDGSIINSQINRFLDYLSSISVNIVKVSIGIFGNFIALFILIFVSFYLLLERKNLDEYLSRLFGSADEKAGRIIDKLEKRIGEWVRAQITLMIIVGVMCYIGLRLLGIDFALPLALLAGVLEVIPNIGPVLSAIPAVLAGLAVSPLTGIAVVALYFLVQQLENNIIVPQVMARGVGVNPLLTILALIVGFRLGGVLGTILAIPTVILIETLVSTYLESP